MTPLESSVSEANILERHLRSSITLLELSIMLLENTYSTGVTYDNALLVNIRQVWKWLVVTITVIYLLIY
jgi:hypothetical protein